MSAAPTHPQAGANLAKRLWLYQADRFPIFKTALLLLVFSAASISISAHLAGRPMPSPFVIASVWIVSLIVFFQMRACDEWKDQEDDLNFRPERPIPSGLVSLRLIIAIALMAAVIAIVLVANISTNLLLLLGLIWLWLGLMTLEFFAPEWIKSRPFIYLVTHMMIMPLIDLFITAAEWMPHSHYPTSGLWVFLCLSFVNGCVLEIGRKVWAPQSERHGVETYSSVMGYKRAAYIWAVLCGVAWMLLAGIGFLVEALFVVATPGLIALLAVFWVARKFITAPTPSHQKIIESAAGLWVFICYALAGFAPIIANWAQS
jgi:4-hydroxybenzoate polyprenyltransferase